MRGLRRTAPSAKTANSGLLASVHGAPTMPTSIELSRIGRIAMRSRSALTGKSLDAAMQPSISKMKSRGIVSPTAYPNVAAVEWLAVANASAPGAAATTARNRHPIR